MIIIYSNCIISIKLINPTKHDMKNPYKKAIIPIDFKESIFIDRPTDDIAIRSRFLEMLLKRLIISPHLSWLINPNAKSDWIIPTSPTVLRIPSKIKPKMNFGNVIYI
tara:strand:- start:57 stop:380 length:324 start_codon:yes stop_codon:yes gene_type:complete